MIPPPPLDPALPGLATAFDADAVAEALTANLSEPRNGRLQLTARGPIYVRYKLGTSCLVRYEIALHDPVGGEISLTSAHLLLYPSDRAAAVGAAPSLRRLVERAARLHPAPFSERAAHIPRLGAIALLFPVDPALRPLVRAAAPRTTGRLATALDADHDGELPPPAVVRYRPGRRAVLRYALGPRLGDVYGRVHGDDRGERLAARGRALAGAGAPTPAPLVYAAEIGALLHPAVAGEPLAAYRGQPCFQTWLEPVAAALATLHEVAGVALPRRQPSDEARAIVAAGEAVASVRPILAARARRLAAELASQFLEAPAEITPIHGDFYDDQIIVSATSGPTLIDLDEAALGDPLIDGGTFLAHLARWPAAAADAADTAHARFTESYARLRPTDRRRLDLHESAALLKLAIAPFRWLEADWPEAVERLLARAEARLRGATRSTIALGGFTTDPALPQLPLLLDRRLMATELGHKLFGATVEVRDASVVRHKPGRRALVRYELIVDGREERIFGKTYASERCARVEATWRAIEAGDFDGSPFRAPHPLGRLPHLKAVFQRELVGEPVVDQLAAGDKSLATRIAEAIHAFHASNVALAGDHDLARELEPLAARVEAIVASCSPLAEPARCALALVEARRPAGDRWRRRPIHRDFYHDQLLLGERGLALLDFDDAAMSEPAVDIANFVAHLRLLGIERPDARDGTARAARAFEARYRALDPGLDPVLMRFLEGATLPRLAAIHLPRREGPRIAAELLSLAARTLAPLPIA